MSHIPMKEREIEQLQKWKFFLTIVKKLTKSNLINL